MTRARLAAKLLRRSSVFAAAASTLASAEVDNISFETYASKETLRT
jgi:hypothetical protein